MSHSRQAVGSGPGGWLRARRTRFALWIAVAEGILVAIAHNVTKWTVVVLAILAVLAWIAGRNANSNVARQVLWIFAASQLIALVLVVLAVIVKWAVILGLVLLALVGLAFLFLDRR